MMNRVPPQAQTYGFPTAAHHQQQRAMASPQPPLQQQQQPQNKGTLVPGQVLRVGKIQVTVDRYLSEGGFAHVYLVKTAEKLQGSHTHVLKRVAVRERRLLDEVRREVEVMKLLRGHPNIVHLHDADAFHLPDGTHEVLILMEFCAGGGIIDLLNARLQARLAEHEILQIFVDVCEGVAQMHSLRPKPLVHRDLKVENVLQAGERSFKLCDFGSAAFPRPPPTTLAEIKDVELDINTHTTMQYRSPEMVDVYQRRPIDEKADIWALGVFLYKLCYYTTPFEEHGPLAILNVQYRVPPYPVYSNQLNLLVGSMLQEHGSQRPSAVQLLKTVHAMRGTRPLIHYDEPISSQAQNGGGTDLFDIISSVGSPSPNPTPVAASITPMRRGRPAKATTPAASSPQVTAAAAAVNSSAPPPNKGPAPEPLSPQYTIASEPLNAPSPPVGQQQQRPELTSKYTIPAPPLDAPVPPSAKPTINVTGETSPAPSPVPNGASLPEPFAAGSWSTFGSGSGSTSKPSPKPTTTSAAFDGFADLEEPAALRSAKTASSQTSGFSAFLPPSAQASLGPPPSLPPRKGSSSSFSAAAAFDGFADSFSGSFVPLSSSPQPMNGKPAAALWPHPPSSASTNVNVPLLARETTPSAGRLSAATPTAGPAREPSFDERYPSVEDLDLRSASTSPLPSPAAPAAAAPGGSFVAHAGRSYTGSAGQPTPSFLEKEPVFPLPRTAQVTGVAMRGEDEIKGRKPAQGPSSSSSGGGGDVLWGEADDDASAKKPAATSTPDPRGPAPKKQLDDWLTGDVSPAQATPNLQPTTAAAPLPPTQPAFVPSGPSSALPPPLAVKPTSLSANKRTSSGGIKGPRSPPAKAAKPPTLRTTPSTSIMSDSWSPVEAARAKLQTPLAASSARADLSDNEPAPPEDPTRAGSSASNGGTAFARLGSKPPPVRSWSKPDPIAPKPTVTAGVAAPQQQQPKSALAYSPSSFSTANAPRRLPTVDSDSAASFLRGSSTLGRASTISSSSSARPRPRPQSLYSSSSFGGAADALKTSSNDGRLPSIADAAASTNGSPSSTTAAAASTPAPVPLIAPKPQRRTSVSNVAQRYERGSPLSPTFDGGSQPLAGGANQQRFGGGGPARPASQQSRTSTLAKQDLPPLKNITPEATGGRNGPAVVAQPERRAAPAAEAQAQDGDEPADEESKSVKSLISRWNQQR